MRLSEIDAAACQEKQTEITRFEIHYGNSFY